jgi:hypothetical protein
MRANQRIHGNGVYVIFYYDEIAGPQCGIYSTGRIGKQQRSASHATHQFNRENHRLPSVALVPVATTGERRDSPARMFIQNELAGMSGDRSRPHPRNIRIGEAADHIVLLKRITPAASKNNGDIRRNPETFIRQKIRRLVENPISTRILSGDISKGENIFVKVDGDNIVF